MDPREQLIIICTHNLSALHLRVFASNSLNLSSTSPSPLGLHTPLWAAVATSETRFDDASFDISFTPVATGIASKHHVFTYLVHTTFARKEYCTSKTIRVFWMDGTMAAVQEEAYLRQLHPHWNFELIAASLAVSLLGAFTSTQLMCQARISLTFSSVLVWTLLGSLTFGFCGVWSLHEVAMLGYELDVQMGISGGLTILSAVLAVVITFFALASDLLLDRFKRMQKRKRRSARKSKTASASKKPFSAYVREREQSSAPLLQTAEVRDAEVRDAEEDERENYNDETSSRVSDEGNLDEDDENAILSDTPSSSGNQKNGSLRPPVYSSTSWARRGRSVDDIEAPISPGLADYEDSATERSDSLHRTLSDVSTSRRSSSILGSSGNSSVIGSMMNIAYWKAGASSKNAFVWTAEALYTGCTRWNILKGLSWSLAITSMHYVGLLGLKVPNGFIHFQPGFIIASAIISWVVCLVGCILMASMETHLQQQLLFAVVATTGVAAMHFTGKVSSDQLFFTTNG